MIRLTITIKPDTAEQYRDKLPDDQLAAAVSMWLEEALENYGSPISSFKITAEPHYVEPPTTSSDRTAEQR